MGTNSETDLAEFEAMSPEDRAQVMEMSRRGRDLVKASELKRIRVRQEEVSVLLRRALAVGDSKVADELSSEADLLAKKLHFVSTEG